jgi:hypothetical protein
MRERGPGHESPLTQEVENPQEHEAERDRLLEAERKGEFPPTEATLDELRKIMKIIEAEWRRPSEVKNEGVRGLEVSLANTVKEKVHEEAESMDDVSKARLAREINDFINMADSHPACQTMMEAMSELGFPHDDEGKSFEDRLFPKE